MQNRIMVANFSDYRFLIQQAFALRPVLKHIFGDGIIISLKGN